MADPTALVVVFMCNHCPYVKILKDALAAVATEYQAKGVAFVGINANDYDQYPNDSPEKMLQDIEEHGYPFPYLVDHDQTVAHAFRAACTPDLFVFDAEAKLVYRGQFDDARPGNDVQPTGGDLRAALDAILAGKPIPEEQKPATGCGIKWRSGNVPEYL